MASGPVGVICGLAMEADTLRPIPGLPGPPPAVTGARPDRAETEARRLVADGARVLVSWGMCGGLAPDLPPGALLLPGEVVAEDGRAWPLAPPEGLAEAAGALRVSRLLGVERVILDPGTKRALARATGADALDMETHRVAAVAAEAGIPAFALRAVADPAGRALPRLAAGAIDDAGRPRIGAVLFGLLARPGDLPALLRAGRDSAAACRRLAAARGAFVAALGA